MHKTTNFLEFDITPEGMHISDAKVQRLKEWLKPTTYIIGTVPSGFQ